MSERIFVFDTTLRDGEQSPGASMNMQEKLRLAQQLEKLQVDVIEAGFPAASTGDFESVRLISGKVKNCQVAALARANREDIKRGWEAVKDAANPRIHTFIATSDIHLKYKLKMTRDEVVQQAVDSVKYARSFTENVEFSTEDGSRTDLDFMCRIVEEAIKAGATTINIPDTVGYGLPDEFGGFVRSIIERVPNSDKAIFSVHCHDDLGLAVANSLAGIRNGARQVEGTINGIGERAGNASLEEIVMLLRTRKDWVDYDTNIDAKQLYPTSRLVSSITGIMVQPNKAIVGANAFAHESGIHQDGMLKHQTTYEIMLPADVGLSSNSLVLGKHSGRHALKNRLQEMGYELSEDQLKELFKAFKELADKKKEIQNEDIEALVAEKFLRIPDRYRLLYLNVVSGTVAVPTATIQMDVEGEQRQKAGFGMGPIDATFNTIREMVGSDVELLRFTISAITGGTDAQGEVTVRLKQNGVVALGKGTDPDIITASAKAYINGLNRIAYLKANPSLQVEL
jgi:2-isopropylmalate synthase